MTESKHFALTRNWNRYYHHPKTHIAIAKAVKPYWWYIGGLLAMGAILMAVFDHYGNKTAATWSIAVPWVPFAILCIPIIVDKAWQERSLNRIARNMKASGHHYESMQEMIAHAKYLGLEL